MIYAVAARADAVQRVVSLIKPRARGFDVIDIPELCLRNIAALLPQDQQGVALIAIGEQFAQLTLTCRGILYLARRIDLGRRPAGSPGETTGDFDVPSLALELQRSLDYYESHFDRPAIADIVVTSGDERAQRLLGELIAATGHSVTLLDVEELFDVADGIQPDTRWPGLLALGAALRSERGRP
jgi:MSHA biogenesis protein MshI